MKGSNYPVVEVRCDNCSHLDTSRNPLGGYFRLCTLRHDDVDDNLFQSRPGFCRDFRFKSGAARDAMIKFRRESVE